MANIKSNIKTHKQDVKQSKNNKSIDSSVKTSTKKVLNSKSKEDLKQLYKNVDSACSKGIYKKNKANRIKSRLAKKANKK